MGRLVFILTIALMGCALSLVSSQYKARSVFVALEKAQAEMRELEVDARRLQLEQSDHAKHALIDQVARGKLKMEPVTPARTIYLAARDGAPGGLTLLPYGPPGVPLPATGQRGAR